MDEIIKQASEIDNALHEVAQQRDELLSDPPTLSPARQALLANFLVEEFPVEAALREAAANRDQLLGLHSPRIPVSAESTLRQLVDAEPAHEGASEWMVNAPAWLRLFRSPLGTGLTVCAMITAAILCFGKWDRPSRRNAENFRHPARMERVNIAPGMISDRSLEGAELVTRKMAIGPFNLSTSEPASLQASFLANSTLHIADGIEAPLGLRLDLPVRAILTDDGLFRTP
jgi:hypothetical protein